MAFGPVDPNRSTPIEIDTSEDEGLAWSATSEGLNLYRRSQRRRQVR
jgi:hypothetical protein